MSSAISRSRAIGSYGGYLQGLGARPNLRQPRRLATTTAKPKAGKSQPSRDKPVVAIKKTRFATTKTSQPASARAAASPTTRMNSAPITSTRTSAPPETTSFTPLSTETSRATRTRETEIEEEPQIQMPLDPKSKEYKQAYNGAARRYTAIMVSIPLLFVTSYYLFKRLAPTTGARPSQSKEGQPSNA